MFFGKLGWSSLRLGEAVVHLLVKIHIGEPSDKCKYVSFSYIQIAGLTNNSYLAESHEIRHCVTKHKALGEYVLEVAKVLLQVHLIVLHICWSYCYF